MIMHEEQLERKVDKHPYPLLFTTISGAHLYGFPSEDSDYDLRGSHVLPLRDVIGLDHTEETIDRTTQEDGLELDLVTHDVKKFFEMMLKKNGYVLEQIFSPLVVLSTPAHDELMSIAHECVTRHHHHHYLGFAANQWKLLQKQDTPRVKQLLYLYRVLLTGIHLMQTGEVESNLSRLNDDAQLSFLDDLMNQKKFGGEKAEMDDPDLSFHEQQYQRLRGELEEAALQSTLPEQPAARPALDDLLFRLRMAMQ